MSFTDTTRGGDTTESEQLATRSRQIEDSGRPRQWASVDADHAAVADDQHVVAVAVRGGDALDGLDHARLHVGRAARRRAGRQPTGSRTQQA